MGIIEDPREKTRQAGRRESQQNGKRGTLLSFVFGSSTKHLMPQMRSPSISTRVHLAQMDVDAGKDQSLQTCSKISAPPHSHADEKGVPNKEVLERREGLATFLSQAKDPLVREVGEQLIEEIVDLGVLSHA